MKSIMIALSLACISSLAMAADLTPRVVAVAPVQNYDWSGIYVGVHGAYAKDNVDVTDINGGVNPGPFSYKPNAYGGGFQLGYNYQFNNFVIGTEADLTYVSVSGSGIIGSANAAAHQNLTLDSGFFGDVTGRIGYSFGPVLIYGKGGYAFYDGSAKQTTTNPGYVTNGTSTFNGWVAGAGVEYMIMPRLSLKAEYLHYDFGSQDGNQTSVSDPPVGYVYKNSTSFNSNMVKVGANFKFMQ